MTGMIRSIIASEQNLDVKGEVSEVDATRTQELNETCRRVQLMDGKMSQFQKHTEKNAMKMCEFECECAEEFSFLDKTLDSQSQQRYREHTSELCTEFSTQIASVLTKTNTETYQANTVAWMQLEKLNIHDKTKKHGVL